MPDSRPLGQSAASRVPVMLSAADLESLIHAVRSVAAMERPSPNTMTKLRTALRRVDPERTSDAWKELDEL